MVTRPEIDVTGRGSQVRSGVDTKRRRDWTAGRLAESGFRTVEGLACCNLIVSICMDGGFDAGQPLSNGRRGLGMFAGCGEVIQRSRGHAFMGSELGDVSMGDGGELVVC